MYAIPKLESTSMSQNYIYMQVHLFKDDIYNPG